MKKLSILIAIFFASQVSSYACDTCNVFKKSDDFKITGASVIHNKAYGTLEFDISVVGNAGATTPTPVGKLDMAPVLAYVFPTTLKSEDVGFSTTEGIVALALTSHPDFDDSPLWDENADGRFDNDGIVWHPHWVVLVEDKRVSGGLAVKEYAPADQVVKPTTAPDMPMFMDSPGFPIITDGHHIRVSVPAYRMKNKVDFKYDVVTCFLEVSAPEGGMSMDKPMLGVYNVFSVLSGDLSLPYSVK